MIKYTGGRYNIMIKGAPKKPNCVELKIHVLKFHLPSVGQHLKNFPGMWRGLENHLLTVLGFSLKEKYIIMSWE